MVGCRACALSSLPPPLCSGVTSPVPKRSGGAVTCQRACHGVAERRWVLPAPCALGTEGPRPVCLRRHRNVLPNSCAMCCEISGAHGSHCPLCPSPYLSVLFRTHPYRHCSQYRLCAMHTANRRECALFSGERTAHGARGKPYFSPVTPFRPACCTEACGTQCGFFTVRGARPTACGDGAA